MSILSIFSNFFFGNASSAPRRIVYRDNGARAAIIFVHGFSGDTGQTWGDFPKFLIAEPLLAGWDVYAVGFPSSLRVDVPDVWAADPDLDLLSNGLTTSLSVEPFRTYEAMAVCAHSMGGLILQRALLDDSSLQSKLGHVFLFGTPSGGLHKARFLAGWKRQIRDMQVDSGFIAKLRTDWKKRYGRGISFDLRVVAGLNDEFVPPSSSLQPFKKLGSDPNVLAAIPGNHISIVKPTSGNHEAVRLVVEALSGVNRVVPPVDSAFLAVELGQFRTAVDILEPRAGRLDDNALIGLALALDAVGRTSDALKVLEKYLKRGQATSSDALGTLGGRLKRRWLVQGNAVDYQRAREMYENGFALANAANDHPQVYYHAINLAFLDLMGSMITSSPSSRCILLARTALQHCKLSDQTVWRSATEGEALLLLSKPKKAYRKYAQAVSMTKEQRQIDSMYAQASRVARRLYGDSGAAEIEAIFGLKQ